MNAQPAATNTGDGTRSDAADEITVLSRAVIVLVVASLDFDVAAAPCGEIGDCG